MTLYETYRSLTFDKSLINLEVGDEVADWFCTPVGATVIGWENSIHYCFIDGFEEMVFAVNPEGSVNENGEDVHVYPLAENFEIFIRLILAAKCANHIEQIIHFNKNEFQLFCENDGSDFNFQTKQRDALNILATQLNLTPIDDAYEYVKQLQRTVDLGALNYPDAYYETLGIAGCHQAKETEALFKFNTVSISVVKNIQ